MDHTSSTIRGQNWQKNLRKKFCTKYDSSCLLKLAAAAAATQWPDDGKLTTAFYKPFSTSTAPLLAKCLHLMPLLAFFVSLTGVFDNAVKLPVLPKFGNNILQANLAEGG